MPAGRRVENANGTSLAEAFSALRLAEVLSQRLDTPHHGPTAAVAAVIRAPSHGAGDSGPGNSGPELLFIERAAHEGDPWSGQMAFPGGRTDPDDDDTFHTAVRETREEIGFMIAADDGVRWLGRLDDLHGSPRWSNSTLRVTPHICWLDGPRPRLALNYEVADALWVPVSELADPSNHITYRYPPRPRMAFPGIEISGGRVIWGLTLRMLADLFARVGHRLALPLSQ